MMETILRSMVTLSVGISCPYNVAWDYLTNPLNQKEWGVHFYLNVEEIDGQFIATVPFGKLPLVIHSDKETGVIDIALGDGEPIRTRLIRNGENGCMYNFTLAQPSSMPDVIWENEGLPNMKDELNMLKTILEKK